MLRMIVPSLINAFLGYIGALLTLSWRVAPTALVFERLGARDAAKQGRELIKPQRFQLVDVLGAALGDRLADRGCSAVWRLSATEYVL